MTELEKIKSLAKDISKVDYSSFKGETIVERAMKAYRHYLTENDLDLEEFDYYRTTRIYASILSNRVWMELILEEIIQNGINEDYITGLQNFREEYLFAVSILEDSYGDDDDMDPQGMKF